ncbi:A-kinase anchor protein 9 isoform X2 [Neopsephotus bourkii]|uniref:A-kinase anchor protein 9 isoform X2 n=1 Tax=Neopsephotus bourkii TaxID=309878 RepID=UPI002AA585DE|nr:A-kinase anchor protein 9 isoform X2 [Neopsephotus bourkii]
MTRTALPADLIREEDFGVGEICSEHGMQHSHTQLEVMENELAGKQQEIEELSKELEEMRAAYGTEGLQQLQEFEAAIKKRDDIITQLTTNLQQARKEKDETMREFLELTEQSQKLQIQFQHLQASEALRNTSHSCTAADLLQAKQQIISHQQQLEEQEYLLKNYQIKNEEFELQITHLRDKITTYEVEKQKNEGEDLSKLQEKEALVEELEAKLGEEEKKSFELKEKLSDVSKLLEESKEQISLKMQEINNMRAELTTYKQKERQCSDEIKQLMGTVEELQKRCYKDSQSEADIVQRMELETQRRLAQLQAELDEMHGQQIVQMKQELIKQHAMEMEQRLSQQKVELEKTSSLSLNENVNKDQMHLMTIKINEMNVKLQDADNERKRIKQELLQQMEVISAERSLQQTKIEDLLQELNFSREQVQRAKQNIVDMECKLNEAEKHQFMIEDLKTQLASASEFRKELELKHEAEVTNYKIKLEMLEREKDAVLDRMAESQEAELERLRTNLLFSHEEELSRLKEDLQKDHMVNMESLKDNLNMHHKQQLDEVQNEMSRKIKAVQYENDNLLAKQNQLILEISNLKDLQESVVNSKCEEMTLKIHEMQNEIEVLRQEEKEKGTLEQEIQELQLKTELMQEQMREREDSLQKKCSELETQNNLLKGENKTLEDKLKGMLIGSEENVIFNSVSSNSEILDLQKRIEKLITENEQLKNQNSQLQEDTERQKSAFAFTEKKLEASYKELQKECATLLKAKTDLEEDKKKQEAEYKIKLKELNEKLHYLQSNRSVLSKTKTSGFEGSKEIKASRVDTFEAGDFVEKDVTELMEKLEVAQHEKLELSLRLSSVAEQLKSKHNEICHLNEKVKSLKDEKEQVLAKCKELEVIISHVQRGNSSSNFPKTKCSKGKSLKTSAPASESRSKTAGPRNKVDEGINVRGNLGSGKDISHEVTKRKEVQQMLKPEQSLVEHLHGMTDRLSDETSSIAVTQSEKNLQQQVDALKSEQTDLQLQMEAQRICLSLVYSAHVDQVREHLKAEKESALCSLKEELVHSHLQEMNDLKKMHQLELQTLKIQQADDEVKSTQRLIEKLNEAVTEECSRLAQVLCDTQNEHSSAAIEVGSREQDIFHRPPAVKEQLSVELPVHRGQAQVPGYLCNLVVQERMDELLHKITEEYSRLKALQTQLMKDCKQVKKPWLSSPERRKEEQRSHRETGKECLQTTWQDLMDPTIQEYCLREIGNLKTQLEEQHTQELEHLRSYFQQQLKESEERYTTEIVRLQDKLHSAGVSSDHMSVFTNPEIKLKEVFRKVKCTENLHQQRTDEALELPSEIEMQNDLDAVQLLEKQYQERLEEEIAKVIVSMSVELAKQTELSGVARQKEEAETQTVYQQGMHFEIKKQYSEEVDSPFRKATGKENKNEELKSLCKELSEESGEINSLGEQLHPNSKPSCVLGQTTHESVISEELLSHVEGLKAEVTPHYGEMTAPDTETASQLLLYEERLEDMRQELVRQYQEHQQATELLRQGHMQQMERQKENQEQLLAELESLKVQLAEHVSMENDSLVAERERMLLEELESLKQHSASGREKLACELRNNSTQTENENENPNDMREQIFEHEDGGRKHDETSSALLSKERDAFQKANEKLMKILLEVVKTTVAMEETIGRHVLGLLDQSGKGQPSKPVGWGTETEESVKPCITVGYEKDSCSSYHGSSMGDDDTNMWSGAMDEGLLSQHLAENGVEIDPENEELILNISSRLQAAVEKLLEAINETSNQLEHAKITQTELMRESFKRQQEATEFIKYQEELQEHLNEETKAREQLALELSKAEGLIDGYADEKAFLEKQLQEKIDVIDHLEQELLCTGNKLQELEAEQQQIQEEKELLSRQKDAMRADAGPVEQQLLEETEKLMKEKIEVQRQAEKEYGDLQKQVKVLEIDLEEQVNRFIELEQEKNAELMDLRQQNQALEKQLEKTRKFLDEQAIDREHERDVFQQEIQKLEQQLKIPQRSQPVNEHQTREVEQLTNHLKEKTDKCSELLLSKEQLQRDIQEQNEEIEKLECRIRELEQALIISADNLQKVEERKQFGTIIVKGELPLEVQLQAEREAVDRKEKEVTNLEEQLEQFREELENKNEEVQQLNMQLEIQRKEATTRLQELEQENKLYKDEMEILGLAIQKSEKSTIKDHHLVAGRLAHIMREKEQEVDHLHEQIAKLQQQLEATTDNKVVEEQNEHIRELEAQVECLKSDQECVKKKNYEEVEQLNDVIDKLQQELANIEPTVPADFAALQEDADSLKHTLETVLAEKEALEKQVESANVEASQAKNELEETKLKMNQLKQEISMLKKEHERITEKYKCALMKGDREKTEDGGTEKVEEGLREKIGLLDQSQLASSGESTGVAISKMEVQLQQLQACIKEKDSELCQSYNEIKALKEQGKAERQTLKKRILELEKILVENVAAALVSQVQLNAVQEQRKYMQEMQESSKYVEEASKNAQTEGLSDRTENEMGSKFSVLKQRLSEMEDQLATVNQTLEIEKENVRVAQKEAKVKEERLLELQQLLEEVQEKHKGEIQKYIKQEEMQTCQVGAQLLGSQKENVLINELELEQLKEEAAAAKEELNSYREKSEKLQQELAVKEASLIHLQEDLCKVKENLVQAEERLASYVRKDKEMAKPESKKDAEIACDLLDSEPTPFRKSSSSQTDKAMEINSCIQTLPVLVKNAEIQNDLQSGYSSEEIAEIIREFTDKIDQMQELHAAEIMDMETRHISESEALKREKFVAVQVLTEECNTLKEVIESLQGKEGIPVSGLTCSPPCQGRDGGSSDSSSDWSQGMYLAQTQGSDTISEGIDEGETSTDLLPKKIKGLLRAVHHEGIQVLSLTEFPYGEREMTPLKQEPESWLEERKAFLSTISSLKDLIAKMQLHREAEIYASAESPEGVSDWRGELLHAIQQLFVREQNVLLAAFQTELAELGTRDAVILMNQLEHRLQEQATNQRAAMDCLQSADRRSLLMEIQVLHAQMNSKKNNPKREQEMDSKSQEMLEYNMQQKQSQILEMQVELRSMKDRAAELQEQLNSERMMGAELKNELAQAKLELEATLKAQHKHFKDLETIRTEVKEKACELDVLKDTMASEQKKSRELQWALEKEKARMERSKERGREELEDLKFSLEDQKQKNLELTKLLEQEKQLSTDLQQKIESQEVLSAAQLSRERGRNSELQVLLESEKVRALEISSALEREKELCAQLQSAEDKGQAGAPNPSEELLKELQKQMDEKHDRVVELVSEMEKYKLESVQVRQQMEKERQIQRKALQAEQDANIIAQKKLHELESKVEDLQWQLGEKKQEVLKLGNETKKLQEIIQELQKQEQENGGRKEAERTPSHNTNETTWDTPNDRTRKWVLQQKMEGAETNESTYPTVTGAGELSAASEVLQNIRQKLQNAFPKLKQLARKAASRLQFETADDQDFIAIQNAIEEVISELQKLPGLSYLEELKLVLPPGTPSSSLTERLLRQNAELTGFVSRLSEEKNNLRNAVMKLEEELRRYQHRQLPGDYSSRHSSAVGVNIDTLASEKETWNREKLSLQKSLKQADAELSRLRAELRSEAFLRELGSDSENAVLRRIYGKYLRAESFRKALIYQKKYLLLLLGGFQECEEATLALIARMGGQPSYTDLEIITHHSKGFTRFRSAVRVSIAISRMKFLVHRWQRVTGSGILSVNRDVFSQSTGNELRPDSFSGGMDLYGEQRHSYRSRFPSMQADFNPASFACSQLQNYDPERALTDYIHRLEALQRRLGSVQSGSTSYTQLHVGMRR